MTMSYPILFSHRDLVAGNGFVAFVAADGHALLTHEDAGCWLYGVTPGGIAGGGLRWAEAVREFKKSYLSVLFDIAGEADSFGDFQRQVEAFFHEVNEPNREAWDVAHGEVKQRSVLGIDNLPRVDASTRPCRIEITLADKGKIGSNVNEFDEVAEAARSGPFHSVKSALS